MEKVYKTKIAIWLICAIIGFTVIPIIPVLVYDFSWIVVTIVALILFFALFSLFVIRYTIHNNILCVKCGMSKDKKKKKKSEEKTKKIKKK